MIIEWFWFNYNWILIRILASDVDRRSSRFVSQRLARKRVHQSRKVKMLQRCSTIDWFFWPVWSASCAVNQSKARSTSNWRSRSLNGSGQPEPGMTSSGYSSFSTFSSTMPPCWYRYCRSSIWFRTTFAFYRVLSQFDSSFYLSFFRFFHRLWTLQTLRFFELQSSRKAVLFTLSLFIE